MRAAHQGVGRQAALLEDRPDRFEMQRLGAMRGAHHRQLRVAEAEAFGGAEFTFASMPRFGVSTDVGYRRSDATFEGFSTDRLSLAVAGHWYIR